MRTGLMRLPLFMLCFWGSVVLGAQDIKGPLTASTENPNWFVDADGQAVWLTGSHTWASLQERGVEGETPDFDPPRPR